LSSPAISSQLGVEMSAASKIAKNSLKFFFLGGKGFKIVQCHRC